jgi:hypothetical protein
VRQTRFVSLQPSAPTEIIPYAVAGKISTDRLATLQEGLDKCTATKKPVVKESGGFQQRGDFRVKVDEKTLELDNLWKAKGM